MKNVLSMTLGGLGAAAFICDALGVEAAGVSADRRHYRQGSLVSWNLRELFATAAAWWDVNVTHPMLVLGEPIWTR